MRVVDRHSFFSLGVIRPVNWEVCLQRIASQTGSFISPKIYRKAIADYRKHQIYGSLFFYPRTELSYARISRAYTLESYTSATYLKDIRLSHATGRRPNTNESRNCVKEIRGGGSRLNQSGVVREGGGQRMRGKD